MKASSSALLESYVLCRLLHWDADVLALPVSQCTLAPNAKELFIPVCVLLVMATNSFARCAINEE